MHPFAQREDLPEIIRDKQTPIKGKHLWPEGSDRRFLEHPRGLTVFLAGDFAVPSWIHTRDLPGLNYIHADRIPRGPYEDAYEFVKRGKTEDYRLTPEFFERMLQRALGEAALDLRQIITGVSIMRGGYAWHIYGVHDSQTR
jgi:hypothetical protein